MADSAQQETPTATAVTQQSSSQAAAEQPSKQAPAAASETNKNTNAAATSAATSSSTSPNIEFEPPAACIRRLLKAVLPKSTNVSKDSLAAISRASGIFVLYLTACANDVAREGRRTTIVAKDVLGALKELDFEEFVPLMEKCLEGHRKEEKNKKEEKERLKKQQQKKDEQGEEQKKNDPTTGKFVAKDGNQQQDEDGGAGDGEKGGEMKEVAGEEEDGANAAAGGDETAAVAQVETKHARDDEGENNEGEKVDQPLAKKQKVAEGDE